LPEPKEQQALISDLTAAHQAAAAKRAEAQTLRASAWTAFESALFTRGEFPASNAGGSPWP
jgi:type I restriction enzyme S subunit